MIEVNFKAPIARFIGLVLFIGLGLVSSSFTREQKNHLDTTSLDEKIAQMILIGVDHRQALDPKDTLFKKILKEKVGGIILFQRNIQTTNAAAQLKQFVADMQAQSKTPLFIAIDEEGGKVHRLKETSGFVSMPSAQWFGQQQSDSITYVYARRLAIQLKGLGINLNFAPVVDLAINPENPVIAKVNRSYGADAKLVVTQSAAFIKAHKEQKVITSLKHFPGHGSSTTDSHLGLTDVTRTWKQSELLPYKRLVEMGLAETVLSSHVVHKGLDTSGLPATLSYTMSTTLLRDSIGFQGVLFSDDMQMAAIKKYYGLEVAIQKAIEAGIDVLVFGNHVTADDQLSAIELHGIIKSLVLKGIISEERINLSYQRIMKLKQGYLY
jgi:beta-N-acetylhexosaminidase